jgi:RNA polymerase sigma-70 factor (ECF subfamily)
MTLPGGVPAGSSDDDAALAFAAGRGDAKAFGKLVEKYQVRIYRFAFGMVKDRDDAWDIAQETFLRAHVALPGFRGRSAFSTWLYRIAANLSLDGRRRRQREEALRNARDAEVDAAIGPISAALAGPHKQALRRELLDKLDEALASLPPIHRAILLLREVDGLSYEELATVLEIPKGTVMSRLFNARLRFQRKLRAYLAVDGEIVKKQERAPPASPVGKAGRPEPTVET